MNIPKAIEILEYKLQFLDYPDLADFKDALQLGSEALKQIQIHRTYHYPGLNFRLEGEDPE